MSTMNEAVMSLAAKIEAQLEFDTNNGTGTVKTDVYHDNLPEGLTKEVVTQVKDYDTTFVAAATYAAGKLSVAAMAGNQNLRHTNIVIPMGGKDSAEVSTDRESVYHVPSREKGKTEEVTKFGSTTTAYEARAGKNGGQLKLARQAIAEMAMTALKKA